MDAARVESRGEFARHWFEDRDGLDGLRAWYDGKASRNKRWHTQLSLTIVAAGAATAVVQLWSPSPPDTPMHWVPVVTALLGASVVIAKGVERIWSFDGNWKVYRRAAEALKRERRLFVHAAGPYAQVAEDAPAEQLFIDRCEAIISAEEEGFWGDLANEEGDD